MNLINIPKSYIPTSEEMCLLESLVTHTGQQPGLTHNDRVQLRELARKVSLLDSVFRAAEEPTWEDYIAMCRANPELGKATNALFGLQSAESLGKPPAPTDENGSFPVGKCPC